jgi:hypothetical protein
MSKLNADDVMMIEVLQEELKEVKQREYELRNKIVNHFRYGSNVEGVQHKSLEGLDIDIIITLKLNRKANSDALDTIWADLTQDQRDCIKYTPEVKVGPYKKLVEAGEAGELVNCITETPGLASVSLKYDE